MSARSLAAPLLVLVLALALGGCGDGDGTSIRVFASASLTEAFGEIARAFETHHPDIEVELNLAGTPVLVRQLDQGAPGDVFASADPQSMEAVVARGRAAGEPVAFATNTLEIVVETGNPQGVRDLAALRRESLVVALAANDVPAGRYTRDALARAGVSASVDTFEPSVKAIVSKVALGEVDVGVVYRTDVRAAAGRVAGVPIGDDHNVRAVLPIATLDGSGAGARAFVEFVLSPAGQQILQRTGFGTPDE